MTIFGDRSKLKPGYVPDGLVGREAEFRRLSRLFVPVLEDGASQRVLIHGPGGSGKTALALRLRRELQREGLEFVYVDCRRHDTHLRICRRLASALGLLSTGANSASRCLRHLDDHLERKDRRLVVALDWLDFQVARGDSDLLYYLLRLWECREGGPNRISIIGLSRIPDLLDRLETHVRSSFMHQTVDLEDYSKGELEEILRRRADLAFRPGAVDRDTVRFIAENSPSVDGARMAIDWLLHAGTIAEGRGRSKVTRQEVGMARRLVHERVARRDLKNLETHDHLILLAAVRRMRSRNQECVDADEVEEEYEKACREHGEDPRGHSTFFRRLEKLSDLGIIERSAGEGTPSEIRIEGNGLDIMEEIIRDQIDRV